MLDKQQNVYVAIDLKSFYASVEFTVILQLCYNLMT